MFHEAIRQWSRKQILKDWWLEVKDNFWEDDVKANVKTLLKELMEQTLQMEIQQLIAQTEPAPYRNGYYQRGLVTHYGLIPDLKVPRLRQGGFKTRVFTRYGRHQALVENLIEGIFLSGVSTRKVGEALAHLLETKVSATTVSRLTQRLDAKVATFHRRPLPDHFRYLVCDGITLKIKYHRRYHNRKVLVVYGITTEGKRELLDFRLSQGESRDAWEILLHSLYQRGLEGKPLTLLVMDGSAGLKRAAELVYPQAAIQRCWVHKLRNVANYCRKRFEADCLKQARKIYLAPTRTAAVAEFARWQNAWQAKCPKAVHCLHKDLDDLLACFAVPTPHRIHVRTTNAIERSFREVRRRTRVFSCFSNPASCERIIFAIFAHLNASWLDKPLAYFTQFN